MGCPGQIGQVSLAALWQTVMTKCILGAPGLVNSSQLLLRARVAGKSASSSSCKAYGLTRPAGRLPALKPWKVGAPRWFRMASARIERAEFPVHRNRTLYCDGMEMNSYPQQEGPQQAAAAGF